MPILSFHIFSDHLFFSTANAQKIFPFRKTELSGTVWKAEHIWQKWP